MIAFPTCPVCNRRYPPPPGRQQIPMRCTDCHVRLVMPGFAIRIGDADHPGLPYPEVEQPAPAPPPPVAPPVPPPPAAKATPSPPPRTPPPTPSPPPPPRTSPPPKPTTAPYTNLIWAVRGAGATVALSLVLYVGCVRLLLTTAPVANLAPLTPNTTPTAPTGTPPPAPLNVDFEKPKAERTITIDPMLQEGSGPVYLVDLMAFGVVPGPWPFGRGTHGQLGERRIVVGGTTYERGLSLHPDGGDKPAQVSYALGRACRRLQGAIALGDDPSEPHGAVTFAVFGDGQELWRSPPVSQRPGITQFDMSVRRVDVLTLVTNCPGSNYAAHAVWLDPVVTR